MHDTRWVGKDDWASRLEKVMQGQNNNPIDKSFKGLSPAQLSTNQDFIGKLKEKSARYLDQKHERDEKRARTLGDAAPRHEAQGRRVHERL